jgi:transposase
MEEKRKKYTPEFKREAVKLMSEVSMAQVSRDLGVDYSVLRRWKKEYEANGDQAFPGKGRMQASDEAIRRLQRELDVVRMERDILKKAVAIFSRGPK